MTPPVSSPYWSGLASSLSPYIPGEQPKDKKYIKLNTNENPYPPSPKVIEAIHNAANEDLRLYPEPSSAALREATAKRWGIKPEQIFAGNGSDEILAFAFAAFFNSKNADSGSPVQPLLFPDITYSFYPVYAALWNIPFKTIKLGANFAVNPDDYKAECGGVILPNPNAPTGLALDRKALKEIAAAQEKNKKVFIIDEAYIEFANLPDIGSMIPFINEFPNLLVIRTMSKDASLAGLRIGYAVGSEELIEGLCRVRDSFNSYTMDRVAQAAAVAAVNDYRYYDEINARVRNTRDRVTAAMANLGFNVIPSQANFIFASPPEALNAEKLFAALKEKNILVRHFIKPGIENFLRISIGTDQDMDIMLAAFEEIFSRAGENK